MSLGLRLDIRQTQGLVLTPQLQQAIKLLQMSNLELASVVERELAENPFLARSEAPAVAAVPVAEREPELAGQPSLPAGREPADEGWQPGWQEAGADRRLSVARTSGRAFDEPGDELEGRLGRPATLAEHLRIQIAIEADDAHIRRVADQLVGFLEEDGYLRECDDALAGMLGVTSAEVATARRLLQRCEPVGVGARDLADCLGAQLRERDRLDPAMQALLANLPLVARADFAALQRVCKVDLDDVRDMITELKQLDPRPGLSFAPPEPVEAVPDVVIYRTGRSHWRVELNQATLPRVLTDRAYYGEVSSLRLDRREREFLSERWQAATWLAKALDQRARTMLRVAKAIFERQLQFLEAGPERLRPLVLRDIAEATGLHESTVSRATADKFVATPRGTFPLRYFFTTAIAGTNGEDSHSAEAIRQQIRRMIEDEDSENVLSDDQIVIALKSSGVVIARRTVAKYRESLGIASSVQRRRSKALSL